MHRPFRLSILNSPPVSWLKYKIGLFAVFCLMIRKSYYRSDFIQLKLQQCDPRTFDTKANFFSQQANFPVDCYRLPQNKRMPIRLVLTGAMNPPHPEHVIMAVKAMRKLKDSGYEKVSIVICPSHDDYVQSKACCQNRPSLNINARIRLAKFLVDNIIELDDEERRAITVSSYRSEKNDTWNLSQRDIVREMQAALGQTESVGYLVGEDVYKNLQVLYECDQIPCVVIARSSNALSSTELLEGREKTIDIISGYAPKFCDFLQKMYDKKNCTYIPEEFDMEKLRNSLVKNHSKFSRDF